MIDRCVCGGATKIADTKYVNGLLVERTTACADCRRLVVYEIRAGYVVSTTSAGPPHSATKAKYLTTPDATEPDPMVIRFQHIEPYEEE